MHFFSTLSWGKIDINRILFQSQKAFFWTKILYYVLILPWEALKTTLYLFQLNYLITMPQCYLSFASWSYSYCKAKLRSRFSSLSFSWINNSIKFWIHFFCFQSRGSLLVGCGQRSCQHVTNLVDLQKSRLSKSSHKPYSPRNNTRRARVIGRIILGKKYTVFVQFAMLTIPHYASSKFYASLVMNPLSYHIVLTATPLEVAKRE